MLDSVDTEENGIGLNKKKALLVFYRTWYSIDKKKDSINNGFAKKKATLLALDRVCSLIGQFIVIIVIILNKLYG